MTRRRKCPKMGQGQVWEGCCECKRSVSGRDAAAMWRGLGLELGIVDGDRDA